MISLCIRGFVQMYEIIRGVSEVPIVRKITKINSAAECSKMEPESAQIFGDTFL